MEDLRQMREEAGMTQVALAKASGVDRGTIIKIESGKRSPSIDTLEKLARAMGAEIGDFFPKGQAPLPLDYLAGEVSGAAGAGRAEQMIQGCEAYAVGLATRWNRDIELYERHEQEVQPYREFEMAAAVDVLYRRFWGALGVLQRYAKEVGGDPDVRTWDLQSKEQLLKVIASIRALAELYEVIKRSTAQSGVDREDFRAVRQEFATEAPALLTEDPRWPEAIEKARAAAGLA